jgi:hypothetical protein
MNPPYPTTPVPGQGIYATPQHYPPQQQQQQQQQYQQGYSPVETQGQMQPQALPQALPQTQTHLQPYYPPSPHQPACPDGADGGYYYHDDKYDSLRGYNKERETVRDMVRDKDKDKTKAERARDKQRALERRPTLGDSVMAAVGRVAKVLGGQRR